MRSEDKAKLLKMSEGTVVYVSWGDGGGGEVTKHHDKFYLNKIPMYGGEPNYYGKFEYNEIDALLDVTESWT